MKSKKTLFLFGIGGLALLALAISCATVDRVMMAPPLIPGAKYVGMDTCATCHEKTVKNFKRTQHAKMQIEGEGERVQGQGCEGCHGPGSLHVDAGGGKGKFIINPGKNPDTCFQCHLDKKAQFSLKSHHPVIEGKMSCNDCHDPHGDNVKKPADILLSRGVNATCAKCHREQSRPKVYEHAALREGCTTCHNVHGSINDKMLTERDGNLCLKCHSVLNLAGSIGNKPYGGPADTGNHLSDVRRGACFSCHIAIHGSNMSPAFRY